jgi:hypothetical protein
VNGSKISLSLTSSRKLLSGFYGPLSYLEKNEAPKISGLLLISDRVATSPILTIDKDTFDIPFSWTDTNGLDGDKKFTVRIESKEDIEPSTYLQNSGKEHFMLPEETINIDVSAADDFGIKEFGLELNREQIKTTTNESQFGEVVKLFNGLIRSSKLNQSFAFCPAVLKISPQKIILRSYVSDYFPNRSMMYSEPLTIYILSRAEHSQLLKNDFDQAIKKLEEATRKERSAFEENQRIERLTPEELRSEKSQKNLGAQQKIEQENIQRIEQLQKDMEHLLNECTRNGEIDKSIIKKIAASMKSLSELAKKDMPNVLEKLNNSIESNTTPEQTKKDIEEATKKQNEVLKKMEKTLELARGANKDMESLTFLNRFKKASADQESISKKLIDLFQENLGGSVKKVDPSVLSQLDYLDKKQVSNASDINWIEEDLANFFSRTNKPIYEQIQKEMSDSKIAQNLEELRELMKKNHSFRATNLSTYWTEKLNVWARELGDDIQQANNTDGSNSNQRSPEDEDFEFMLRVMKMIQKQQDLRSQTRALEDLKRSSQLK